MQYWMFTLVVLIALVPSIISLKCYVCNSNDNSACASGGSLSGTGFAQDCNVTVDPYCRKILQTVDSQTSTVRACGSKLGSKSCYKTAGTNNANVCSCNTDLCNHGISFNRQQQRSTTIFASIIVLTSTMIILR